MQKRDGRRKRANMNRIKVDNYGDMLESVSGKKLLSYTEFGSYQGDWIAVVEDKDCVELWRGYYGSCSGCDFIEGARDWEDDTVDLREARNFFKESRPFLTIGKDVAKRLSLRELESLLPENSRRDMYDFDVEVFYKEFIAGLNNAGKIDE